MKLDVFFHGNFAKCKLGTLLLRERRIFFEYDPRFIQNPWPVSPFLLPLRPGVFEEKRSVFGGLHGLFADSLPDGWGLMLMDRYFRSKGLEPGDLSPLHRLAYMGDRAMGALSYEPSNEPEGGAQSMGLEELASSALEAYEGRAEMLVPQLLRRAGSPGGARPKVLVGLNGAGEAYCGPDPMPWGFTPHLIKFSAQDDLRDAARVEFAYAQMAMRAGIAMPLTRLLESSDGSCFFCIKRFDRELSQRVHMHSLAGLVGLDYRVPNFDYQDYLKAVWLITRDRRQLMEAFKRMLFNVFAHNQDDHTKNFSFILPQANMWKISPAYDLVFSQAMGEHQMAVAGEARNPVQCHFLTAARAVNILEKDAVAAIDEVATAVAAWPRVAKEVGVAKDQIEYIRKNLRLPK